MLIATAGHVDHGKTSLVQAMTGIDTDRLPEEKARGLTIDLGFAHVDLADGLRVSFVDVPGHERFVRNMVAGVGGIDFALLVIAADDGVMPQTREHLAILNLLGVPQGAVALTKADRVDADRVRQVKAQISELLEDTPLNDAPVFVASGVTGDGVPELVQHIRLKAAEIHGRAHVGHFRMAIDRSFTVQGIGLVVTGTVLSGTAAVDDQLLLQPGRRQARVRGLRAKDKPVDHVSPGVRCAANIVGNNIDQHNIGRGIWLVDPAYERAFQRIDVDLSLLSSESTPLKHWTPGHFHFGAADIPCRIALLEGRDLSPGETSLAQLLLDQPTLALHGDRFVLRDQSARRTIGGGMVVDPYGLARGRARPERLAWLREMRGTDHNVVLANLGASADTGLDLKEFALARNLRTDEASALIDASDLVQIGGEIAFSPGNWATLRQDILSIISDWHETRPEDQGPTDEVIRRTLRRRMPLTAVQYAIDELMSGGEISRTGGAYHLPDHQARASEEEQRLWQKIEPLLTSGGLRPARELELVESLDITQAQLQNFFRRATALGLVYRVSKNRVYPPDAVLRLARLAEELAAQSDDDLFTAAEYRDLAGIGRNLTIEVLEFLDKIGLTRRAGNKRRMLRRPEDVITLSAQTPEA